MNESRRVETWRYSNYECGYEVGCFNLANCTAIITAKTEGFTLMSILKIELVSQSIYLTSKYLYPL